MWNGKRKKETSTVSFFDPSLLNALKCVCTDVHKNEEINSVSNSLTVFKTKNLLENYS